MAAGWPATLPLEFAVVVPPLVSSADKDFLSEGTDTVPLDVPEVWLPLPETRVDSDFSPADLLSR